MYFRDRAQAGEMLANRLEAYTYEESAVVALSTGGVLVGEQIARRLKCPLSLLLTARISAPNDPGLVLGTIDQVGDFSYNQMIPAGQMEEYMEDMRNYLEEEKMHQMYEMASLVGAGGLVERDSLRGKNVILATDGVKTGMSFDGALLFLKPIEVKKIIAAVPVGPGEVIEKLNVMCDEVHYLYIPHDFFSVSHYYEDPSKPPPDDIMQILTSVPG